MLSSPDKDIAEFTANRFRLRYVIALALIATLTLISQWVIQLSMADEEHDSASSILPDVSAWLSQKITKTCYYLSAPDDRGAPRRPRAVAGSAGALAALPQRSATRRPGTGPARHQQSSGHRTFPSHRAGLSSDGDGGEQRPRCAGRYRRNSAGRAPVGRHEGAFLRGMDAIVFRYDSEAKEKVDFARHLELGLAR